jgi:hypothetical protein
MTCRYNDESHKIGKLSRSAESIDFKIDSTLAIYYVDLLPINGQITKKLNMLVSIW